MKIVNIGGQALIEGVMMKNEDAYCAAVRKPDQEIVTDYKDIKSIKNKFKILKLPFVRGVVNFVEMMVIGVKTLTFSAEFFDVDEEEDAKESKFEVWMRNKFGDKFDDMLITFSVFIAMLLGVGLFMIGPMLLSELFQFIGLSGIVLKVLEGAIRIGIFLLYITLISRMKDIQRVFMYHGAEHKTINCLEHEEELTVENVKKYSRLHKRCGTSFLFIVMIISILVFSFVSADTIMMKVVSRLLLVPVVAGISYEILKLAGKSNSKLISWLTYPGIMLQKLTTREPEDDMIEVAIVATKGVLEHEELDTEAAM